MKMKVYIYVPSIEYWSRIIMQQYVDSWWSFKKNPKINVFCGVDELTVLY